MKKHAALLLCLLLIVSLALPAGAQAQKLLYPGSVISGEHVYLVGIPMEGGSVRVTANGQEIPSQLVSVAGAQLGVTYYCVVSTASSMSQVQRNQQYAGLSAVSDAIGADDAMVLVTLGRTVEFGEKITDKVGQKKAIDEACGQSIYGTNLYEGIDNILKTLKEQEQGPCCVIFFADGIDNADVVKLTEDQAGRALQDAGLCVNFVALLAPPVSTYTRNGADRLQRFATLSNGGVCKVPLDIDNINPVDAAKKAVQEMVSAVGGWSAIALDAASLPREGKSVELNVSWTGNGVTLEDGASVSTSDLPALPAPTEPETKPVRTLPELPAVTEAAILSSEPTPSIPTYQTENNQQQLYYVIIGSAAAMVLIMVAMVIVATRRTSSKRRMGSYYGYGEDMPVEIPDMTVDPKEVEALEQKISGVPKLPPRRKSPVAPVPQAALKPEKFEPKQPKPQPKPEFKAEPKPEPKPQPMPEPQPKPEPKFWAMPESEKKQKRKSASAQPFVQPTDETFIIPSCTVLLTPVADPDTAVEVSIPVNGSRTFGRNQKANVVLCATDSALSGLHFALQWDGRVLYLNDCHSTNGTALNGSPQRPDHWGRVESGSTIQAGARRYKVTIIKN